MPEPWTVRLDEWIESGDAVRAIERGPLGSREIVVYSEDFLRLIRCPELSTSSREVGGDIAPVDLSGTILSLRQVGSLWLARVEWDDETTTTVAVRNLSRKDAPLSIIRAHHQAVEEALKEGLSVPIHVLSQYPDLSSKYLGVVHPDFYQYQDYMKWLKEKIGNNPSEPSIWRDDLYAHIQFAWELIPPQYHQFRKPVEYYYGQV